MNFLSQFKKLLVRGINTLSGRASAFRQRRKPVFPLADRLLADALRLAEIPSPSPMEGERAAFVLERLRLLGTAPWSDEGGNVFVRLHSASLHSEPLLLFTDLGSKRWHPLESLSRLDAVYARGAGLADVLGAAALLSVAEEICLGRLQSGRDILLLFAARSFDDPESNVFLPITESPPDRPFSAVGIRGFLLGSLITHIQGTYRMEITISSIRGEKEPEEEEPPKKLPDPSNMVVDTLIATARRLSEIRDTDEEIRVYIRRVEAGAGFGRTPSEGILEIELESSDGTRLDMAMNRVKAIAEVQNPELRVSVNITSFIPAGDPSVSAELSRKVQGIMRGLHIKVREENGSDPSSFLANHGIPAVSLGIARGREGLSRDTIEISSIEKGRLLLEALITHITREEP
ncbi:MAG: hypothetical protein LBP32_00970 [Spirochaetaceae bacterium]|nr:hypothetical protein [Spirochaetaceae bacterium]